MDGYKREAADSPKGAFIRLNPPPTAAATTFHHTHTHSVPELKEVAIVYSILQLCFFQLRAKWHHGSDESEPQKAKAVGQMKAPWS